MLLDKLKEDLKTAMKERREFELGVLRMLTSAIHNRVIENRGAGKGEEMSDEDVLTLLGKEAKKRREAAALFEQGKREDLKEKEIKEAEFIEKYLPAGLSEAEIEAAVKKVIDSGVKEFGPAMKEAMKELKGRADGKVVGEMIKKLLA